MPKRLVVCCDGTWNTADQHHDGRPCPTNVTRFALGVAERGEDGVEQRVYYQRGVGTRRGERLRGGAFGVGLSRSVQDAYRFLVDRAKIRPGWAAGLMVTAMMLVIGLPLAIAAPTSGAHAAVLVWPDIFGLRPAFRQMGKRLAEQG